MTGNCRTTVGSFAELVDGALDAVAREAAEGHLFICPRCTELLVSYRATGRIFRDATRQEAPIDLEDRLLGWLHQRVLVS